MTKNKENLVDEGFRISLIEHAFFDGDFEIPHIDGPKEFIIPTGMVPFSLRERSVNKSDFVCFYEHDINFREILTHTEQYVDELKKIRSSESKRYFREGLIEMLNTLEPKIVLVYGSMPNIIFGDLLSKTRFIQYPDWTTKMKTKYR